MSPLSMNQSGCAIALCLLVGVAYTSPSLAVVDCAEATPVYMIQGESHVSTFVDQRVQTCGVVTAVAFNGYYLQDPVGDENDSTSDGIFVAESDNQPNIGTLISLDGLVSEEIGGGAASGNLSVTTLTDVQLLDSEAADESTGGVGVLLPEPILIGDGGRQPSNTTVISQSETTPPVNLQLAEDAASTPFNPDTDAIDFYESLEGMRVSVSNPVAVSAIRQFGRFSAEVFVLSDNGSNVEPADARTERGGIALQPDSDNQGDQNPERIQIQFDGTLFGSTDYPAIKVGDTLDTVTGVMSYSFGNFEVVAVGPVRVSSGTLAPENSGLTGRETDLSVASYNVLNLSAVEADDAQMAVVGAHIAVNLLAPDIVGLQEVQDNNGDIGDCPRDEPDACSGVLDASETLQKLIDAIVSAGGPQYSFLTVDPLVETNDDNRDNVDTFGGASLGNIRNAFLYNPERVDLVSSQGITRGVLAERGVSVANAFDTSRDPLEAVFDFNGEQVTIVNNHFSSRFGSSPIFGGPQPFVQAGEENRAAQSLAMHELVLNALDQNPDAKIVVLGDLNTFEFTNELEDILPAASDENILTNLIDTDTDTQPYSFIFEGNSQALDHIFVSNSILDNTEADYVNVNVDFPRLFDSVVGSDHDPVLARITLTPTPIGTLGLTGEVYSETALELFWDRNASISQYEIFRDSQELGVIDGTSFFDQGLENNTRYNYVVVGLSDGLPVLEGSISLQTDSVGGPGVFGVENLTGSVYSSTALELFWDVSQASAVPTGFDIERDGELVGTTDGRSFFEEGLTPNTSYSYSVTAFEGDGNTSSPRTIELRTRSVFDTGPVTEGPDPVPSLTGLVYSSSAVEIFWEVPDSGSPAVGFQILRDGELLVTNDGRSFFDADLSAQTQYTYSVVTVDARGALGAAVEVELTTGQ